MSGIYIHIPFCKQACNYCNFHFSTSLKYKEDMLTAIGKEMSMQRGYLENTAVETIYWGGGTPSLLSADELLRLWDQLQLNFPDQALTEVTLEANPDDLNPAFLQALKHTPVNRLSIGIQSFQDQDLKYMNRAHNAQQADYAVKLAQDKGFDNISIDLIYGTPTMSHTQWKDNLQQAVALGVPHISSYALTVEPATALAHAIKKGTTKAPADQESAYQFEQLMDALDEAGYEHYEISNFAQPGRYARHNTNYWKNKPYLGLGPSAHSYNGSSRKWNIANNAVYMRSILQEGRLSFEQEQLSEKDRYNEYIMVSLRTMWGIDLDYIAGAFGNQAQQNLLEAAQRFAEKNWINITADSIKLSRQGRLFADRIASDLFLE
jgi:oxygen-independent coproporphyrinogen-3 oxidase